MFIICWFRIQKKKYGKSIAWLRSMTIHHLWTFKSHQSFIHSLNEIKWKRKHETETKMRILYAYYVVNMNQKHLYIFHHSLNFHFFPEIFEYKEYKNIIGLKRLMLLLYFIHCITVICSISMSNIRRVSVPSLTRASSYILFFLFFLVNNKEEFLDMTHTHTQC